MRILFAFVAIILLATFSPPGRIAPEQLPPRTFITFSAIPLDAEHPARQRIDRLEFLGGWRLRSNDPRFGGISAMHVEDGQVLAVSDAGSLIRFPLLRFGGGVGRIDAIPDGPGAGGRKQDRDAEAMTVAGRRAWIGFERHNSLWRYDRDGWRSTAKAVPRAMRKWRANAGSEGMARLADGRFLVFSEGNEGERDTPLLLFAGDPAEAGTGAVTLSYRPPAGYRITDAAALPDGRIVFLNRSFSIFDGMTAKLGIARLPAVVREGMVLGGEEVADLRSPAAIDNMEALSATRERGRTILWIASDDNFSPLQRTLLLKFALLD